MPSTQAARYAYFGPEGTFTEQALRSLPEAESEGARLLALPSIAAALDAVRTGDADAAMVPIENSVEGGVASTLDGLASGDPVMVLREVLLRVRFVLGARRGTTLAGVRTVTTFPHAAAQCRGWLLANLPHADVVPAASTAAAAHAVAAEGAYDAAISSPLAAARYDLEVLADDIGDVRDAVTRFVLVGRPRGAPLPTGHDRTSVVAFISEDHPGALLEILNEFAVRGVNLSRIESRPTGERLGSYCFSIDADGHVDDARVGEALMGVRRVCADVRFLGSYPRADPRGRLAPVDDHGFREAQAWLARVREGRVR